MTTDRAVARQGRSLDTRLFDDLDAASIERTPLLDGMVDAWVITRSAA